MSSLAKPHPGEADSTTVGARLFDPNTSLTFNLSPCFIPLTQVHALSTSLLHLRSVRSFPSTITERSQHEGGEVLRLQGGLFPGDF